MDKDRNITNIAQIDSLKEDDFIISKDKNSPLIDGVLYRKLTTNIDGRGDLTEIYSSSWNNDIQLHPVAHAYHNTTQLYVTKGWHYHTHTYSQYVGVSGKFHIVLIDLRPGSRSFQVVDQFIIGTKCPSLIIIPPGILKGWKALDQNSIIINLLSTSDVSDNYKIPLSKILPDIWEPHNG